MKSNNRVLVSVTNDLYTDNRVHKVCTFLVENGYQVTLIGRLKKDSKDLTDRSYKTKRFKLWKEKGAGFYALYNLRLFFYLLFHKADILLANDLDTLLANYAASKFKPGVRLVYDTHEYFTEVPELINRPSVQKVWEGIESWIFPKLTTIYTVNHSIAELYQKKYKKELKVVRNISPKWEMETIPSKHELGIPEKKFLIIIQGAGINIDRGAEEAVEAMKHLEDCVLLIVGDGDVVSQLKQTVNDENLSSRVLFFGKKPYQEMMCYTHHADIGLTLDKSTNINYKYSLPNKVFDYIHADTPIVCTDLIEIKHLVEKYNCGRVLSQFTVDNLIAQINELKNDMSLLNTLKENCKKAAETENWESEKRILEEIFPTVD